MLKKTTALVHHRSVISEGFLGFSVRDFRRRFLEAMPIEKTIKISGYIIRSGTAALLLLTAQISLAGSATWLSSPQDSAWENPNNWTAGGPPNGPSDIATFAQSSQKIVNISTSVEVNSIVFPSGADSFGLSVSSSDICAGGELIISGTGIIDNSSVLQTLGADNLGRIIFNNASTAGHARIVSGGGSDTTCSGKTIFNDSSTAESATLIANGGCYGDSGAVIFNGMSTGGTARVQVFFGCTENSGIGYLDISHHQSGMTIGSIEGDGIVSLGANTLRVGTNNRSTTFVGSIRDSGQGGSLTKVGSGILTLQGVIEVTAGLNLVSGSPIKLDFGGCPEVIAALKVDGVSQPPGIYGGPMSGAPHILPEFRGSGTVHVAPSTLGNISTRAFVQTGDNVMIGGFILEGPYSRQVVIRAIGPGLRRYHVPNTLADPKLELHDGAGRLIASNDNWQDTIIGGIIHFPQGSEIQDRGYAPSQLSESAMIVLLQSGNYTAIVRGVNNTVGVALVEVYDADSDPYNCSVLGNISTRSFVQTGANVMIGGFIVEGGGPKRVIVRAIGPELTQHGVLNPLADPTLELHDATGALIASNDNWMTTILGGIITSDQVQDIRDSGHAPRDPSESAIIATLQPGDYTAIVRGMNSTTGVGLVEVYDLD
jgi:hypothetical protein